MNEREIPLRSSGEWAEAAEQSLEQARARRLEREDARHLWRATFWITVLLTAAAVGFSRLAVWLA